MRKKYISILCLFFVCNVSAQEEKEVLYTVVEQMPYYKDCDLAKISNPKERLEYRQKCTQRKIGDYLANFSKEKHSSEKKNKIYLSFIVTKDGAIEKVKILKGVNDNLQNQKAIEYIQKMPPFDEPAQQYGKAVVVRYSVVLPF